MPTRSVFYSFHYVPDNWRASQVRQMGLVEGNQPARDNDWEQVTRGGDKAIQSWIDGQLKGRSCTIVLIGAETAGRKWINYEIEKSWNDGKGVLGIHIHNLLNSQGQSSCKGSNPFQTFTMQKDNAKLSGIVKTYDVQSTDSKAVYNTIKTNISSWIEEAIRIRNDY